MRLSLALSTVLSQESLPSGPPLYHLDIIITNFFTVPWVGSLHMYFIYSNPITNCLELLAFTSIRSLLVVLDSGAPNFPIFQLFKSFLQSKRNTQNFYLWSATLPSPIQPSSVLAKFLPAIVVEYLHVAGTARAWEKNVWFVSICGIGWYGSLEE